MYVNGRRPSPVDILVSAVGCLNVPKVSQKAIQPNEQKQCSEKGGSRMPTAVRGTRPRRLLISADPLVGRARQP